MKYGAGPSFSRSWGADDSAIAREQLRRYHQRGGAPVDAPSQAAGEAANIAIGEAIRRRMDGIGNWAKGIKPSTVLKGGLGAAGIGAALELTDGEEPAARNIAQAGGNLGGALAGGAAGFALSGMNPIGAAIGGLLGATGGSALLGAGYDALQGSPKDEMRRQQLLAAKDLVDAQKYGIETLMPVKKAAAEVELELARRAQLDDLYARQQGALTSAILGSVGSQQAGAAEQQRQLAAQLMGGMPVLM